MDMLISKIAKLSQFSSYAQHNLIDCQPGIIDIRGLLVTKVHVPWCMVHVPSSKDEISQPRTSQHQPHQHNHMHPHQRCP